ncbi:hypothetical protein E2329_22920 [Salmonella enterica subsp. enterica]|nr:hypothetical protein [Salmonella enterica subsp. enterica serovar Paratyphi A]
MDNNKYLIASIKKYESLKIGPGNTIISVHVKVLKSTDTRYLRTTQIECGLGLIKQINLLKKKNTRTIFVDYMDRTEKIHKGRKLVTIKATSIREAKNKDFNLIKSINDSRRIDSNERNNTGINP